MRRVAAEEEQRYAKLEEKIRDAFQKKFVKADGYIPGADNSPSPFGDINNPNAKARRRAIRRQVMCSHCT